MDQIEVRLEPSSQDFATGQPSGQGELRDWLALPGGEPFDAVSSLFAVDALPPATFDIEFSGWSQPSNSPPPSEPVPPPARSGSYTGLG